MTILKNIIIRTLYNNALDQFKNIVIIQFKLKIKNQ